MKLSDRSGTIAQRVSVSCVKITQLKIGNHYV